MAGLMEPRPHDLLRLADPLDIVPTDAPPWVAIALRESPWVVVRRGMAAQGWVAVGVRGKARAHRFAMDIPDTVVTEVLAPEDLSMRIEAFEPTLPAGRALRAASALLDRTAVPWGPTGSVGFELASNVRTVTAGSDLDLLLRPGRLPPRAWLKHLHVALRRLPARVDCQIETADGALALGEVVSPTREVLVRTPTGPRLIPAPWPAAA
jgi:phosphoribosyl-dephospho-CoA transferase